ncbi:TMhelix containing protein [Vibrio phage 1.121.O._10N.286.46.C4]|nr:TMhelix containing protein [Vibrio phage 1.121.O._10N.286.46.C4]
MSIWNVVTGGVTGLVGKYFDNKKAVNEAKHVQKITKIQQAGDWETTAVGQMASSLKDEWWTFWLSLPLIAIFMSPFIDLFMVGQYAQGMIMAAALKGLAGLDQAPTWYSYLVGISVSASFGIRAVGETINKLRKGGK